MGCGPPSQVVYFLRAPTPHPYGDRFKDEREPHMKKPTGLIAVAAIVGLLFLVAGFMYLTKPAGSLPSFVPGYIAGDSHDKHTKHAIGAIVVAVACFVFAWFQSGPKTSGSKAR